MFRQWLERSERVNATRPHRGLAALPSEAVAARHQVVAVRTDVAVGLDVLFGREGVGHLPCAAVPHSATTSGLMRDFRQVASRVNRVT